MVDLIQFSLVDRRRTTENNFYPQKPRSKENTTISKIFQLYSIFCLLSWLQYAFQPVNAGLITQTLRLKRSPFEIDPKAIEESEAAMTGDSLKVNINGWSIDAKGLYIVMILSAVGFCTFSCERLAKILHLVITSLNCDVERQRPEHREYWNGDEHFPPPPRNMGNHALENLSARFDRLSL